MAVFNRAEVLHTDVDGNDWVSHVCGTYYFNWYADEYNSPVYLGTDDRWYYANWDHDSLQFVPEDLVSTYTRMERSMEGYYVSPSDEDVALVSKRNHDLLEGKSPLPEVGMGDFVWTPPPVHSTLTVSSSSVALPPTPISYSSGTTPSQKSAKRKILLMYVRFKDSTGDSLTDDYLKQNIIGTPDTPDTMLHYFKTNLRGTADISLLNDKIYRVTIDKKAYRFGMGLGQGHEYQNTTIPDTDGIKVPALQKVIEDNPEVLDAIFDNPEFTYPRCLETFGTSSTATFPLVSSMYILDPAVVTPVIILHGQEAAAQQLDPSKSANKSLIIAPEANVHGHVSYDLHKFFGITWDKQTGIPITEANYNSNTGFTVDKWLDPSQSVEHPEYGNTSSMPRPKYKYSFSRIAIFGAFEDGKPMAFKTITHELGHALLGLPDLYDIETIQRNTSGADNIAGVGNWSLMANCHMPTPYPCNMDGYSIWAYNHRLAKPITKSGTYTIDDVYKPHAVICADNSDELWILQLRTFKGYDSGLKDLIEDNFKNPLYFKVTFTFKTNASGEFISFSSKEITSVTDATYSPIEYPSPAPASATIDLTGTYPCKYISRNLHEINNAYGEAKAGILIEHVNLTADYQTGLKRGSTTISKAEGLHVAVEEAHGGTQHLLMDTDSSSNVTKVDQAIAYPVAPPAELASLVSSPIDFSGNLVDLPSYNSGDATDLFRSGTATTFATPNYWTKSGKAPFTIGNISVTDTSATYTITFTQEADDPNYDDLPEDPLRPDNIKTWTPDTPTEKPTTDPDPLQLTSTQSSITITLPNTATVTLSPVNLIGTATYSASESWVTFSGNTATLAPTVAGNYTVTITITDSGRTATTASAPSMATPSANVVYSHSATVKPVLEDRRSYDSNGGSGGNTATVDISVDVLSGDSNNPQPSITWTPRVWDTTGNVSAQTKSSKPDLMKRLCAWYKIPKGSTNIHFEIPYMAYSALDQDLSTLPLSSTDRLHGKNVRDGIWPASIPTVLRDLLDSTVISEGVTPTDSSLSSTDSLPGGYPPPYGYQCYSSVKLPDGQTYNLVEKKVTGSMTQYGEARYWFYFCRSHSASIQVFHTDGKLLSGTPLYGWSTCINGNDLETHNGYVGGTLSPSVTSAGQMVWEKCGIWAEWYSLIYGMKASSDSVLIPDMGGSLPATGTIVTATQISDYLKELYPSIFPSSFQFSDTVVNGDRKEVLKIDDTTVKTISVDGETIKWTGSVGGATGLGAIDHRAQKERLIYLEQADPRDPDTGYCLVVKSKPYEVLDIAEAKEDMIIGILSTDGFAGWGTWTDPGSVGPSPVPVFTWLGAPDCWRNPELQTSI